MINPSELRIGNYIEINRDQFAKVVTINGESAIVGITTRQNFYLTSSFIRGIELTPEWLERCGCMKCPPSEDRWQYELELPNNNQLEYDFTTLKGWSFNGVCLPKDPEYVHQLQNLYFALTGEELTIKEKV